MKIASSYILVKQQKSKNKGEILTSVREKKKKNLTCYIGEKIFHLTVDFSETMEAGVLPSLVQKAFLKC